MLDPLVYIAPVFAAALVFEGVALRRRLHREGGTGPSYALRPLLSALGCVALDQLVGASAFAIFAVAYDAIHRVLGLAILREAGVVTWVVAVTLHDLAYYAFHRASHRVNVLWAAHVVHHQSESYDFTVSARQGAAATWVTYLFYLPVAILIDARVFVTVHAAYQVYQFFVHTRAVGKLGPLEWIAATPSHHRVHHGRERRHLDRNYGGFFIVFDRLFGTFIEEDGEPSYGVPGGYDVVSPLFANTYGFLRLLAASREVRGARALAMLWFGPPEKSAHLMSSAGHAPRPNARPSLARTLVPFVLGFAGAIVLAVTRASLPFGAVAAISVASVVMIELGSAHLDGRSLVDRGT